MSPYAENAGLTDVSRKQLTCEIEKIIMGKTVILDDDRLGHVGENLVQT